MKVYVVETTQNSFYSYIVEAKNEKSALRKMIANSVDFKGVDLSKKFTIKVRESK